MLVIVCGCLYCAWVSVGGASYVRGIDSTISEPGADQEKVQGTLRSTYTCQLLCHPLRLPASLPGPSEEIL